MKFAFLILGDFRPEADRAAIHGGAAQMRGVSTLAVSYTHLTLPTICSV